MLVLIFAECKLGATLLESVKRFNILKNLSKELAAKICV